uniref:Uncharacterized protein n=1 Tax=Chelonoidis abingdonii TaxID=106734 RepID=A0A8C0GK94_CHEAB
MAGMYQLKVQVEPPAQIYWGCFYFFPWLRMWRKGKRLHGLRGRLGWGGLSPGLPGHGKPTSAQPAGPAGSDRVPGLGHHSPHGPATPGLAGQAALLP